MKTITNYGMSWEILILYYQIINEGVKAQLATAFSKIILFTVWNLMKLKMPGRETEEKEKY